MPQNTESYAALDLGSNSFHLLIASFQDDQLKVLDRHKDMVRLAAGLDENGNLSDEAQSRALDSLAKMANRLSSVPKTRIRVVGTNTLRAANNAADFMSKAEALLGVPINIISGTEEARLVYLGVAKDFAPGERSRLVADIGGGSTEIVAGNHVPRQLESLPMGCVNFSMRYFPNGEISEKGFKKAVNAGRRLISPFVEQYRGQWQDAVGSSGTIRAIGRIMDEQNLSDAGHITRAGMEAVKEQLLSADNVTKLDIKGLTDDRGDVFPGGFSVLYALFQELDIQAMHVSTFAVREGIVYDLAGRLHHRNDTRDQTISKLIQQFTIDIKQGDRVAALCEKWLPVIQTHCTTPPNEAIELLRWGAQLHELGLAIAHGGYHKHGAYILTYADMPGFSRQEQARLSFLVLNHRRKPKPPSTLVYGVTPDWLLATLLRLACIFYRRRQTIPLRNDITLHCEMPDTLSLTLPASWMEDNPLVVADLEEEVELLKKGTDIKLNLQVSN